MTLVERLGLVAGFASCLFLLAAIFAASQGYYNTLNNFPVCDSGGARNDVIRTMNGTPTSPSLRPTVIDVRDVRTISNTASEEVCHATFALSDDTLVPYTFRYDHENGRTFIRMQSD